MRIVFMLYCFISTVVSAQKSILYFNQPVPVNKPVMFAPKIVSDEFGNRDMAISPKGDELFYTLQYNYGLLSVILYSKKINSEWSEPQVAGFSGKYKDLEPSFSPDGNRLYFSSNRPVNDTGETKDYDIWVVTKANGAWSNLHNLDSPVNTKADEYYASVAKTNNIYFTRAVEGREEDIVVCKFENGKYSFAISLPDAINSVGDEFNAYVDPAETFIIFSGYKRPDSFGSGDLYISKKNNKNEWQQAKNLGTLINSSGLDYCPYITPDKKLFFFTSNRNDIKTPFEKAQSLEQLKLLMHSSSNGYDDIYWMNADAILAW